MPRFQERSGHEFHKPTNDPTGTTKGEHNIYSVGNEYTLWRL